MTSRNLFSGIFFANEINIDRDEITAGVARGGLQLKEREMTSATQLIDAPSDDRARKPSSHSNSRPISWCFASKSETSLPSMRKEMSKSEHSINSKKSELVNTISLAEELSAAAAHTNEFKFPSGFFPMSTSKSLNLATLYDDLGSPDVIEPPSLVDSGYYQEAVSSTPLPVCEPVMREHYSKTFELEADDEKETPTQDTLATCASRDFLTPTNDEGERLKTPDQVRVLNEVNTLKTDSHSGQQHRSERAMWLQGLLTASLCNRCKSSASFDVMQRSLEEQHKSPTDLYIDDAPKQRVLTNVLDRLTLEFQGEGRESSRYDVDKSALQLNFQTTPMDESVDLSFLMRRRDGDDVMVDLSDVEVTHRCCHKFVPRHRGELFIEIGDPLYVEAEEDDLWSKGEERKVPPNPAHLIIHLLISASSHVGINLRSKKKGIFPSVCAIDLNFHTGYLSRQAQSNTSHK